MNTKTNFLTPTQLQDFARDGFLVIPKMYSQDEISQLSAWIDEIAARPPEIGKQMNYYEDSLKEKGARILSRIEKFVDYHAGLRQFVYSEKMIGTAAEILRDEPVLFKEKINFKLPGGDGFLPHQDIQPGWDTYTDYFISVLVTIDKSTVENGCLELSAGHHTRGLIGEKWKPLTQEQLKGIEFVQYPMEPGDVAFFDCFVPHQSKPNLTDKPRRNLYLTFNRKQQGDHRGQYFSDKRASFPPDFERDANKVYKFRV